MDVEQLLYKDFLSKLDQNLNDQVNYVTTHVAEDYPERVGMIKALRSTREEFLELLGQYFPHVLPKRNKE